MKIYFRVPAALLMATAVLLEFAPSSSQAAQILRRQLQAVPETLDPAKAQDVYEAGVDADLFEGLVDFHDGAVIPGVAESWERQADGLTYIFHLRKDARWSNGDPVTAADFVYAWRRKVDPKTAARGLGAVGALRNAKEINQGKIADLAQLGVEALDEHTLRAVTAVPSPEFIEDCARPAAYPAPQATIERWGDNWIKPEHFVGNGAFALSAAEPGGNIVLTRNRAYWNAGEVMLDEVDYMLVEDHVTGLRMFRAGEIDAVEAPDIDVPALRRNHDPALHTTNGRVIVFLFFNMKEGPFASDHRLREALALSYDPLADTEKLRPLGQKPAYSWVSPAVPNYTQQEPATARLPAPERLARARRLYAEAGYGPDHPLHVTIYYATDDITKLFMPALAQMWKQALGVETDLEDEEFRFLDQRIERGDYQIALIGEEGGLKPQGYLDIWSADETLSSSGYVNPELSVLLQSASTTVDNSERRALYEHAERLIVEDIPGIPIEFMPINTLVNPRLKGWTGDQVTGPESRFLSLQD